MTVAYTLETEAPQVPVIISVPNAEVAAQVINETIKWSKASGIHIVDFTFVISL